jgi:FkbM family methyltransferase
MYELGAGFGRWLMRAAKLCERYNIGSIYLTGIEGEPTHYRFMREHFANNGIDPSKHRLIHGAVSDENGETDFYVGKPSEWYGQQMATKDDVRRALWRYKFEKVKTIAFAELFDQREVVDLIDIDVQGAELKILLSAPEQLDSFVKRIHIGTHSLEIEEGLRKYFTKLGWEKHFDFSLGAQRDTPWGRTFFMDGVQSWINPKI